MTCKCIGNAREMLREKFGDPEAQVGASLSLTKENKLVEVLAMKGTYRKKKKDGTFSKTQTEILFYPTYCCFCGEKIRNTEGEETK